MTRYKVTYYVGEELKETIIEAEHTSDVFTILEQRDPDAHNIKIEHLND